MKNKRSTLAAEDLHHHDASLKATGRVINTFCVAVSYSDRRTNATIARRQIRKCGIRLHGINVVNQEFWQKTKTIEKKRHSFSKFILRHFCFLRCKKMSFFTFRCYDPLSSSKFNAQVKKPLGCRWSCSKRLNLRPLGSFPHSDWLPEKHKECSKPAVEETC